MPSYSTPGVYIEEVPVFPPSVAPVATAIPAFIGYTAQAIGKQGEDLTDTAVRLTSLLEYEAYYGKAPLQPMSINVNKRVTSGGGLLGVTVSWVNKPVLPAQFLHYAMQLYFANGGGPCYVYSVGRHGAATKADFIDAIAALEAADEPTLLVFPDAVLLSDVDYGSVVDAALASCNKTQDRFTVADVRNAIDGGTDDNAEVTTNFRARIASNTVDFLKYGAAYFPYIETNIPFRTSNANITMADFKEITVADDGSVKEAAVARFRGGQVDGAKAITAANKANPGVITAANHGFTNGQQVTISGVGGMTQLNGNTFTVTRVDANSFSIGVDTTGFGTYTSGGTAIGPLTLKVMETAVYAAIEAFVGQAFVTLPPSAAVAGVYARVDRTRGVWKAPANAGLNQVIAPAVNVTNDLQDGLNIDATTGKSVNAIRSFFGKGTLVWGGRTLAGNDNEWRYINVRRFANFVEESVKKATAAFVFEANNANTWVKVRTMIENFLINQWRDGALMGAKPEHAFRVAVGLGQTMSAQDILDGYMIVEVHLAIVRPAEFIVLRFMQKMPES